MSDHVSLELFRQRCSAAIAAAGTRVDSKIHHLVASARAIQNRRKRGKHVGTNESVSIVSNAEPHARSTKRCGPGTQQVHKLHAVRRRHHVVATDIPAHARGVEAGSVYEIKADPELAGANSSNNNRGMKLSWALLMCIVLG